ncbi:DegV family protein [Dubosiella newyorkensis]|uniref:DegV family protein n=1 Tax=Dubosiella newyorkensis TaxID=1862672 RepID=UPI003F663212
MKVITDSGTGLSKHKANELGSGFFALQVIVDDKVYLDGVDLNIEYPLRYVGRRKYALKLLCLH